MDPAQRTKLREFIRDRGMEESVKGFLLERFYESPVPNNDVHVLAAAKLSALLLKDAWKDMRRMVAEVDKQPAEGVSGI